MNLKPATIFAFCCRVISHIVFTISGFDSWSAGFCLLAEQDSHTSIILPLPLNVIVIEGQDLTYCPPFRYVFSSELFLSWDSSFLCSNV